MVRRCKEVVPGHLFTLLIVNPKNGRPAGMISQEIYDVVCDNAEQLDSAIIYNRDFNYNLCVPIPLS